MGTISIGVSLSYPIFGSLKSGEWFLKENDELEESLVEKLRNGAGLILVGFDESSGRVKAIQKDRFPDERLEALEENVEKETDQRIRPNYSGSDTKW